jgi:predicted esterase
LPRPYATQLASLTAQSLHVSSLRTAACAKITRELDSAFMEHFLTSPIRCYYELELPHRRQSKNRSPLLIALHGYQGDKDSMMRLARRIANGNMAVISLQGPNQFFINYGTNDLTDPKTYRVGFGWGTSYKMEESVALHHHNLRTLIDLAVQKHGVSRRQVFLLAFSQACAYNYRFVFSYPGMVRGCIGVCGGVPGDWHENLHYRKARTDVLHIAATDDVWYTREKNLEFRRQLAERSGSLDFRFYKSPHRFPRAAIPHIRKWIEKHL